VYSVTFVIVAYTFRNCSSVCGPLPAGSSASKPTEHEAADWEIYGRYYHARGALYCYSWLCAVSCSSVQY